MHAGNSACKWSVKRDTKHVPKIIFLSLTQSTMLPYSECYLSQCNAFWFGLCFMYFTVHHNRDLLQYIVCTKTNPYPEIMGNIAISRPHKHNLLNRKRVFPLAGIANNRFRYQSGSTRAGVFSISLTSSAKTANSMVSFKSNYQPPRAAAAASQPPAAVSVFVMYFFHVSQSKHPRAYRFAH